MLSEEGRATGFNSKGHLKRTLMATLAKEKEEEQELCPCVKLDEAAGALNLSPAQQFKFDSLDRPACLEGCSKGDDVTFFKTVATKGFGISRQFIPLAEVLALNRRLDAKPNFGDHPVGTDLPPYISAVC